MQEFYQEWSCGQVEEVLRGKGHLLSLLWLIIRPSSIADGHWYRADCYRDLHRYGQQFLSGEIDMIKVSSTGDGVGRSLYTVSSIGP